MQNAYEINLVSAKKGGSVETTEPPLDPLLLRTRNRLTNPTDQLILWHRFFLNPHKRVSLKLGQISNQYLGLRILVWLCLVHSIVDECRSAADLE